MRIFYSVWRGLLGTLLGSLLVLSSGVAFADDGPSSSTDIQVDVTADGSLDGASDGLVQLDPGVEVAGVQVGMHCASWGGALCLTVDATFDGDLRALGSTRVGQALLAGASRAGVTVVPQPDSTSSSHSAITMGAFVPAQNTVRIATTVQAYPQADRLAILAHELQHAVDAANGMPITTRAGCYSTEENAVNSEVRLWRELFDGALPAPRTPYEAWLNTAARTTSLTEVIRNAYAAECGAGLAGA